MLTQQKKITKKQIKEDKLVTFIFKARTQLEKNKNAMLFGVGIIAVLVFGIVYFINQAKENNETAGQMLAKVMPLYDAEQYRNAIDGSDAAKIKGLQYIVDNYGSSDNGETAKIYLANSYYILSDFEKAKEYYKSYSGSIDLFKATASAGYASCLEVENKIEEAADYYVDAAEFDSSNPLNADYMLNAAINYLETGNNNKAEELLKSIKKDYRMSVAARQVDRYLAVIKSEKN